MHEASQRAVPVGDLLESLPDAHLLTDLAGCLVYLNPVAARLLGVDRAMVQGRSLSWLLAGGQDPERLVARWAASSSFRPASLALPGGRRLRCDGARLPHAPLLHLRLRDQDEAMASFKRINDRLETMSLRELSGRLERNVAELRAANRRLEAANEEIRQYAQAVAHDIRNPLYTIQGLAHLLVDTLPGENDGARYVELILESCERLRALTDGVLAVARLEHPTGTTEATDTGAVVAEAIADLAGGLDTGEVHLEVGDLHPVAVDPTALRRVVLNLIANCLLHAPVPGRRLHIEIGSRRGDGVVELSVADDGVGIDDDERDRIFELFQRGERAQLTPGTGIGLASCRKLVTGWGGTIACEPRQGPGVRFLVTAPAAHDATGVERSAHDGRLPRPRGALRSRGNVSPMAQPRAEPMTAPQPTTLGASTREGRGILDPSATGTLDT